MTSEAAAMEDDESKCGVCGHEAADADELETHALVKFNRHLGFRVKTT